MSWRHQAACRGLDPELFFPVGTTGPCVDQLAEAKAVCVLCPVQSACLLSALTTGDDHGVWGGLSEDERRSMRRRTARLRQAGAQTKVQERTLRQAAVGGAPGSKQSA